MLTPKFFDRVKETTAVTGTNVVVLLGVVADFQPFSLYAVGETFYYEIKGGAEWEIGIGTRTADGFTRTSVKSSSNGGAMVSFSAGTKEAFVHAPADFLNGQTIGDLTAAPATIPDTYVLELFDPATGTNYKATVAALKAIFGAAVADASVPALTSASVTNIGTTTATGNVTVGEANGTLYCLASTASTATQAAVEASAFSQAITSTGAKTINMTGLTAGAAQYLHFMQKDAAGNKTPVLSASFSTSATAVAATGVTLTGPTGGTVSVASSNFTAGVTPVGGTFTGTVVVTPSDNGGGGTFNPTSVSLTSVAPTATFSYTPSATAGARSITVTNNGSLTNPAAITYTSTAAASTSPLAITTPATQQAGVEFTLAGTYSSATAPTGIEFSADGVTWYASEVAATIDTTNKTWSLMVYINAENAAQTIRVRNKGVPTETAISAAFAVTAPKAFTIAGYSGNTVKSSYDASAVANSGSFKALTETHLCTGAYWDIQPIPASARMGWSDSATVPPPRLSVAQNNANINGLVYSSKTGANVFPLPGYCWIPSAIGTYVRYLWWKPVDGPAKCMTPSGVSITVA